MLEISRTVFGEEKEKIPQILFRV